MIQIIGNSYAVELTKKLVNDTVTPVLLHGPSGIGKFSLIKDLMSENFHSLSGTDSISKFRELHTNLVSVSNLSGTNNVVIRDFDLISDQVSDYLLKVFEEPKNSVRYFLISSNSLIHSPLISRVRLVVNWSPISPIELTNVFNDPLAIYISRGSYSLFQSICGDQKIHSLYNILISDDWPIIAVTTKLPEVLDLQKVSPSRREAVANTFWYASRTSKFSSQLLNIAKIIRFFPSVNLGNHYVSVASKALTV